MSCKSEKEALKGVISMLEKATKGYEWIESSTKMMAERTSIFQKILAHLPTDQLALGTSFSLTSDLKFLQLACTPVVEACKLLATPTAAGYGYRIELRGEFIYEKMCIVSSFSVNRKQIMSERFGGLYLTLLSPESKVAGVLGFHAGLPFEICMVQGDNLGESQKFFQASNGQSFDIVLLNHFIGCIGKAVYFHKEHQLRNVPKAEFSLTDGDRVRPPVLRRLSQYLPDAQREKFINGDPALGCCLNLKGHGPIKESLFRRAGAQQQRQLAIAR